MISQLKIRRLLRKTGHTFISNEKASQILNTDKEAASEILAQLANAGYIEKAGMDGLWQQSLRGKVLLNKKLKKEYNVSTLRMQLNSFIERVQIVNSSREYPKCISSAIIISEYPINQKSKGIDIAYCLDSKDDFSKKELDKAENELRKRHKGNYDNIVQYLYYPNEAIRLFLKSRSPVLKLKEYTCKDIKELNGHRLIG